MADDQTPEIPTPETADEGLIFGKYNTIAEAEGALKAAEQKIGEQGQELGLLRKSQAPPAAPAPPPETPATPDPNALSVPEPGQQAAEADTVDAIVQRAGVNPQELATQWQENGALADEDYQKFQNIGFPRVAVDEYMRGQAARADLAKFSLERSVQTATDLMGGQQQLQNLLHWSATALTDQQRTDINTRLADSTKLMSAVRELRDMHRDAVGAGRTQPLVQGEAPPSSAAGQGATTPEQVAEAVREFESDGFNPDSPAAKRLENTPLDVIQRRSM